MLSIAGALLLGTILIRMASVGVESEPNPESPTPQPSSVRELPVLPTNNISPIKEFSEDDTQSMKDMKEQMDSDRLQQKKIKMLKLQLEQTNLQLEQEKALSEISKLERENTSVVNDSTDQGQDKYPEVKVIYIGGTSKDKQAILSINGNNYSVKENNKPVKNVEVLSISDASVTVHFNLPQDLRTTIEYKPE